MKRNPADRLSRRPRALRERLQTLEPRVYLADQEFKFTRACFYPPEGIVVRNRLERFERRRGRRPRFGGGRPYRNILLGCTLMEEGAGL